MIEEICERQCLQASDRELCVELCLHQHGLSAEEIKNRIHEREKSLEAITIENPAYKHFNIEKENQKRSQWKKLFSFFS